MRRNRPLTQLPGGPDPERPVPRSPVHGIDLEAYASVSAALAEGVERDSVLERHQLDGVTWLEIEKTWALRIATAAMTGDLALAKDYDQAYTAAQDALGEVMGERRPSRDKATHAALLRRIESGEDVVVVLHEAGLSLAAWSRLHRFWAPRQDGD